MKINIIQLGIIGIFIVAAWLTAFIDSIIIQFNLAFLVLFPFFLLLIYFFTRYNDNRWIFISIFIFLYLLISAIPMWLGLVILFGMLSIEKILDSVLDRFNMVQVLVMTILIILLLSFIYEYQLNFLSWEFIQTTWIITNIQEHVIRVLLGFAFSIIMYPFLSVYESKHKLYLSSY